jgi:glycosyltransferase involved in cell wall biosynthesis
MTTPGLLYLVPALRQAPESGGEHFILHLSRQLAADLGAVTVDWAALHLERASLSPARYREAVLGWVGERSWRGPVLIDSYLYPWATDLVRALRARGCGPVVAHGQAVYQERYRSPVARARIAFSLARFLRACDRHIVVSRYMVGAYRWLGIPSRRVAVVHPGGTPDGGPPPERAPLRGRPLRLIAAGSYQPSKGQQLLLDALGCLARADPRLAERVELHAYGNRQYDPAFVERLEGRRRELGAIGDKIHLHGPVPQAALWEAFGGADIFVFVASGEGFGMVTAEAMRTGCVPVVGRRGPGADDLVRPAGVGAAVAPRPAAIARAIRRLSADPEGLREQQRRAREYAVHLLRPWPVAVGRMSALCRHAADRAWPPAE